MSGVIALLQELIRLPSVNPRAAAQGEPAGEGPLVDFLERWLQEAGLPACRQPAQPGRDNLLVMVPGSAAAHLMLEAHLDTVGTAGMTIQPFAGDLRDDKVWGRGACDDKASVAAMLVAARRAAESHLAAACLLALVVDEESNFAGINRLLADPLPLKVRGAVVGEPTGLEVINRHGGSVRMQFTVYGRAAHSAYPETGENAIYSATQLVQAFAEYHKQLQADSADAEADKRACTVTLLRGGTAINIVPDRCMVGVDRRLRPGEQPAQVHAELEAVAVRAAAGGFRYESQVILLDPPLQPREEQALVELCCRAVTQVKGACTCRSVRYATDASNLAAAGLEAVVLGPGDIAQAHSAEEWVAAEEVEQAAEIYFQILAAGHEL